MLTLILEWLLPTCTQMKLLHTRLPSMLYILQIFLFFSSFLNFCFFYCLFLFLVFLYCQFSSPSASIPGLLFLLILEPDVFELEKLNGVSDKEDVCSVDFLDLRLLDIVDLGSGVLESIGRPGSELTVEFKILSPGIPSSIAPLSSESQKFAK